jgi:hypothetical protein
MPRDLLAAEKSTEASRKIVEEFMEGQAITNLVINSQMRISDVERYLRIEFDCMRRRIAMARTVMGTVETAKYKTMVRNADIGVRE